MKGSSIYQYYEIYGQESQCTLIMDNLPIIFSTSRTYNGIKFHYFFLENNTILIKSSYKTNYQLLNIGLTGYSLSSYAMTEKVMGVTMINTIRNASVIIVYSFGQLYPRKIDSLFFNNTQFTLLSVANYLEKSFYFFLFYDE